MLGAGSLVLSIAISVRSSLLSLRFAYQSYLALRPKKSHSLLHRTRLVIHPIVLRLRKHVLLVIRNPTRQPLHPYFLFHLSSPSLWTSFLSKGYSLLFTTFKICPGETPLSMRIFRNSETSPQRMIRSEKESRASLDILFPFY